MAAKFGSSERIVARSLSKVVVATMRAWSQPSTRIFAAGSVRDGASKAQYSAKITRVDRYRCVITFPIYDAQRSYEGRRQDCLAARSASSRIRRRGLATVSTISGLYDLVRDSAAAHSISGARSREHRSREGDQRRHPPGVYDIDDRLIEWLAPSQRPTASISQRAGAPSPDGRGGEGEDRAANHG